MPKSWKSVVRSISTGEKLRKSSEGVEETVFAWFQEQRDLCLLMSRHVGETVSFKLERKFNEDPQARLKQAVSEFIEDPVLTVILTVPDAASNLNVKAHLARKCIEISMNVRAPEDRKSTKARVNWLLRMIKSDDPRIIVRARWSTRTPPTQALLRDLREDPACIQCDNQSASPTAFDVFFAEDIGARFSGSRTFVEDIERLVPEFYDLVGQNLRAWQAPPPKPIASRAEAPDTFGEAAEDADGLGRVEQSVAEPNGAVADER